MTAPQLVDFINMKQRDPRLNEILHPYANPARAKELINQYEPNKYNATRGQLSLDGFLRYKHSVYLLVYVVIHSRVPYQQNSS